MNPLETEIAGLRLKNPLMLASGVLGSKVHSLNLIARDAGAVVAKSVGLKEREGYRNPTVINWKCGLINAVGLASPAARDFAEELKDYTNEAPLIVSLYGYSADEFLELASIFDSALPYLHGYELNLSCPHVKGAGIDLGMDTELSAEIVEELKRKTGNPVFAKISALHDYIRLAKALEDAGIDGIVISNTLRGMRIDILSGKPVLSNISGGVSGPAIKPVALKCVYDLYKEVEVPVIGCGGITSFEDVLEFIMAGAKAVQIGSAVYYSHRIFYSLKESLIAFARAKGCTISDLVGIAHNSTG